MNQLGKNSSNRRCILAGAGFALASVLWSMRLFAAGPASEMASQGDFGGVGLMQNPTARFAEDGQLSFGYSNAYPYINVFSSLQLLPWLETTLRYTQVSNRKYGPGSFSGSQSYKDKGADFKIRLMEEDRYLPELAVGVRDIGGTSLFGSEYLVGSKQFLNFDFTLGMGWGRLGARGDFRNPLTALSDSFRDRDASSSHGGTPEIANWFNGKEVALFGGVIWKTPVNGLRMKLEVEGNDYKHEALSNNQKVDSVVNVAFCYPVWRGVDLSLGLERGNTFMASISTGVNLQKEKGPPKFYDPAPRIIQPRLPAVIALSEQRRTVSDAQKKAFVHNLEQTLKSQGMVLRAAQVNPDGKAVQVWYSQNLFRNQTRAAGRVARALTQVAPTQIETFTVINMQGGVETQRFTFARQDLEAAARHTADTRDVWRGTTVSGPQSGYRHAEFTDLKSFPDFTWETDPALRQSVGGPDGFYVGQLWWRFSGDLQLTPELSLNGSLGVNIYNNFDDLTVNPNSKLPHVRSDVARYLKEGENNLVNLEADYIWSPAPEWYARLSAGLFEEMYGGIAAELLYRPFDAPWAFSVDINRVRQRDFDQRFDFRNYEVTTGHLTGYFQLPWYNLLAQVSVGRYLAGDEGVTIDMSRQFANGVRAGAFATKTNVSSADFGEGSFDKGFYLSIPLDLFFTNSSRRTSNLVFKPLTRDGGQKVRDGRSLYPITQGSDRESLDRGWAQLLD